MTFNADLKQMPAWLLLLLLPVHVACAQSLAPIETSVAIDIDGQLLQQPYTVELALTPSPAAADTQLLRATVRSELSLLLPALQAALDRRRPRDTCASYKLDNLVAGTPHLALSTQDGALLLRLESDLEVWGCLENAEIRDWKLKDKNERLLRGRATLWLSGRWQSSPDTLSLDWQVDELRVDGSLGDAQDIYRKLGGGDLVAALRDRIADQSNTLSLPLPERLIAVGATIGSARFRNSEAGVEAEVTLTAAVTPTLLLRLLELTTDGARP